MDRFCKKSRKVLVVFLFNVWFHFFFSEKKKKTDDALSGFLSQSMKITPSAGYDQLNFPVTL
jgi:hypothetical protein